MKRCMRGGGSPSCGAAVSSGCLTLLHTHNAPAWEASLNLCAHSFHWGFITQDDCWDH